MTGRRPPWLSGFLLRATPRGNATTAGGCAAATVNREHSRSYRACPIAQSGHVSPCNQNTYCLIIRRKRRVNRIVIYLALDIHVYM